MPELPELPEEFDLEPSSAEEMEQLRFTKTVESIKNRCIKAGIKYEELSDDIFGFHLLIKFPSGRQERNVFVTDLDEAEALLSQPFEKFVFIAGYDAACSYDDDTIEALIIPNQSSLAFRRRLFGVSPTEEVNPGQQVLEIGPAAFDENAKLEIHLGSARISSLLARTGLRPSLVIKGIHIRTHDRALEVLEAIANSLFFEIDVRFNLPLSLLRARTRVPRPITKSDELARKPLQFPADRYDKQAASLYWYGRMAIGMPLLRFLAFYQTIEFYFPVYSERDAIKYVRGLLKQPSFSIYDDKSVSQLLSAFRGGRASAFGDERSQLRATLQSCLSAEGVREFLIADEQANSFFSTAAQWKSISDVQIPIHRADADLRNDIADRIYDIRCKIVHTKSDSPSSRNNELLLPFSREADLLIFDIELAQYVARQVLIMSSSKLTF